MQKFFFNACKKLLGVKSGYIDLLSENENKPIYVDSGGFCCTVDPSLPMPIRGLRQQAYEKGIPVYDNCFRNSGWMQFIPPGHAPLENVLFAPLIIEGCTIGLIGLANKDGGFTDFDADIVMSFASLAAITFRNISITEKLKTEEEHFHSVVETSNDAVICVDSSGDIIYWNRGAQQIFGYSCDEMLNKSLSLIIPEELRVRHLKALKTARKTGKLKVVGKTIEVEGLRKDKATVSLEINITRWKSGSNYYYTGILRDISERKYMEEALRSSERNYRELLYHASDAIILTNIDEHGSPVSILEANNIATQTFGHIKGEITSDAINRQIPLEEHNKMLRFMRDVFFNGQSICEISVLSADGKEVPWELNSSLIKLNGENVVLTIARDISQRKKAEQRLIETTEHLTRANEELEKLNQYKSEFLSNMSHELKTPLTSQLILTNELLSKAFGSLTEKQEEYLNDIRDSSQQLLRFINDLLDLSKFESGKMLLTLCDVNIGDIVKGVVKKMKPLARSKGVTIKTNIRNKTTVIADSEKVEQVVTNLLSNAIKFSPFAGVIKIRVIDVLCPEEGVQISVTDYGPGIPEYEKEKVFNSFYQLNDGLKKEHNGTGLGLTLTKRIIDLHTGSIVIESKGGTTFTVFCPSHPSLANDLE